VKKRRARDNDNPMARRLVRTKQPLDRKKVDAICAKISALPVLDSRTPEEILGYDEYGVPQ
jgi:antitoxin VapB